VSELNRARVPEESTAVFAVRDPAWQEFRVSLKGMPTRDKLGRLRAYMINGPDDEWARTKRVKSYLGALQRGGQIAVGGEFDPKLTHVTVLKEW
jgi:hypothetical protein